MADVHEPRVRSFNMSRISGKNTKPEMLVRKFLFSSGIRYRIHVNILPGHPDLVFPKYKTVLFINGCFWHGHENCKFFSIPKTRTEWWMAKIAYNKARDERNVLLLHDMGWRILVVWECQLKKKYRDQTLKDIVKNLYINEI